MPFLILNSAVLLAVLLGQVCVAETFYFVFHIDNNLYCDNESS